jgi:thiamine kinase-like enzyme
MAACAVLAGSKASEAEEWIKTHGPVLAEVSARLSDDSFNRILIHGDVRSDNLRLVDGRLVMFDWPQASNFPPEFDLTGFAQSMTVEGGPDP